MFAGRAEHVDVDELSDVRGVVGVTGADGLPPFDMAPVPSPELDREDVDRGACLPTCWTGDRLDGRAIASTICAGGLQNAALLVGGAVESLFGLSQPDARLGHLTSHARCSRWSCGAR